MKYEVVQLSAQKFAGISILTTNQDNQALKDISNLWKQFKANDIFEKIPDKKGNQVIALYTDYEGDYTMPYIYALGYWVTKFDYVPKDFFVKEVFPDKYARLFAEGNFPACIQKTWEFIWQPEFDSTRSYHSDFECYAHDFDPNRTVSIPLYISIK